MYLTARIRGSRNSGAFEVTAEALCLACRCVFSQDVLTSLGCSEDGQAQLVAHLSAVHRSAETQLGAVPRSFLSCVDLYGSTVVSKREQLLLQQKFLQVG